jgi:NAD(P)H-hydrate epimerase
VKVATGAQMRAIDRRAIDEWGIPGPVLMEAAGIAYARACVEELGGKAAGRRVLMLCGRGNNGGDGFVAARHLANAGADVTVLLAGDRSELKGDAATHFAPLSRPDAGVRVVEAPEDLTNLPLLNERYDLYGDALLGTGAKGAPTGVAAVLIRFLQRVAEEQPGLPIVAADIPSGVDADNGTVQDDLAVRATRTVTFVLPKPGLLQFPGADYAGRVSVADIGIPRAVVEASGLALELTTHEWMRRVLPPREQGRDANKGTFGTVLVIAGSAGMAGAATLTALSALRAGAGLVMLAVPESVLDTAAALAPEAVLRTLPQTPDRAHGGPGALDAALALADKADSIAIGPGMGGNPATVSFVQTLVRKAGKPLVVDADGLNALANSEAPVRYRGDVPTVMTPHPAEMGRLLAMSAKAVQDDRQKAALRYAAMFNAVALLKGSRTLVAAPDGRLGFNRRGTAALATAGSGDVLTGVIAALLGQKHGAWEAARAGAYLHALAGELAARELGTAGVLAGDVRDRLPRARQLLYTEETLDEL